MATSQQIEEAANYATKRGKKDVSIGGTGDVGPLVYAPGSRAEHRDSVLATYALYRQFKDYEALTDYAEFSKFAEMLGLEGYIGHARTLHNKERNERKRTRVNARRRRKGRASVDYLGDMADS